MDFDLASPAMPAWDVAHLAWQFVPLTDDAGCMRHGWTSPPNRPDRLRVLSDGYGLSEQDRSGFAELVTRRLETTTPGIETLAAEGIPAHRGWVAEGVPALVRADRDWVVRHRELLKAALLGS